MKRTPFVIFAGLLLLFCFLACATSPALASTPKPPPPPPDERKLIKSVDVKSSSLVIVYMRDKSTHAYKIDEVTALKVNNVPGTIAEIKPGMVVDDYLERDNDNLDGLSVSGYGTTATPAKPKTPTKPKPKPQPAAQT